MLYKNKPRILLLFTLLFVCFVDVQAKIIQHRVNDKYTLDVYLPPGYNEKKEHKTIYFNDGEMVFGQYSGWDFENKLDSLIKAKVLEPLIVVGIYAEGHRLSRYCPYEDEWVKQNWGSYTSEAQDYTEGIVKEIIPFMEKNYTVEKSSSGRAIAGFSLSGLHATWSGIKFPSVFGFSVGMSPSFWLADKSLFKEVIKKTEGSRFWFDLGTHEWEYYVPFYKQLQQAGYKAGEECFYLEVKGGAHTIEYWSSRIQYPLIIFAGLNKNLTPVKMDVIPECIPSASVPGKTYRRVNAVVTLANGVQYSLSNTATFELMAGDIKLYDDGTIIPGESAETAIKVGYKGFQKQLTFMVSNCE